MRFGIEIHIAIDPMLEKTVIKTAIKTQIINRCVGDDVGATADWLLYQLALGHWRPTVDFLRHGWRLLQVYRLPSSRPLEKPCYLEQDLAVRQALRRRNRQRPCHVWSATTLTDRLTRHHLVKRYSTEQVLPLRYCIGQYSVVNVA